MLLGKYTTIDPELYDFHTTFDIKPMEVVYIVHLDMNRKKILNIAPDKNRNNSAATLKMVKYLYPFTKNDV